MNVLLVGDGLCRNPSGWIASSGRTLGPRLSTGDDLVIFGRSVGVLPGSAVLVLMAALLDPLEDNLIGSITGVFAGGFNQSVTASCKSRILYRLRRMGTHTILSRS